MSVEAISLVLHHSRASGTAKVILIGIANHQGDGGSWPSITTLARYANVHERNVRHAIDGLVESGEVIKTNRPGLATVYQVTVTCPPDCSGGMNHRVTPGATTQGAGVTPGATTQGAGVSHPGRQRHPTPGASALRTNNEPLEPTTPTESLPTARGTRLPDDFPLTDDMRQWARLNTPGARPEDHDTFVDYWHATPGAKGRKADWQATWRNWMRRSHEDRHRQQPRGRPANPNSAENRMVKAREIAARIEARESKAIDAAPMGELLAFRSVSDL